MVSIVGGGKALLIVDEAARSPEAAKVGLESFGNQGHTESKEF